MSPGAQSAFSGAMGTPVARYATQIEVVEAATFTVLDFQFNGGEAQQVGAQTLTYPPLTKLREVKRFQLATGSIIVAFGHAVGTP